MGQKPIEMVIRGVYFGSHESWTMLRLCLYVCEWESTSLLFSIFMIDSQGLNTVFILHIQIHCRHETLKTLCTCQLEHLLSCSDQWVGSVLLWCCHACFFLEIRGKGTRIKVLFYRQKWKTAYNLFIFHLSYMKQNIADKVTKLCFMYIDISLISSGNSNGWKIRYSQEGWLSLFANELDRDGGTKLIVLLW